MLPQLLGVHMSMTFTVRGASRRVARIAADSEDLLSLLTITGVPHDPMPTPFNPALFQDAAARAKWEAKVAASRAAGWAALGVDRNDVGAHASLRVSGALEQALRAVGATELWEGGGEEISEDHEYGPFRFISPDDVPRLAATMSSSDAFVRALVDASGESAIEPLGRALARVVAQAAEAGHGLIVGVL